MVERGRVVVQRAELRAQWQGDQSVSLSFLPTDPATPEACSAACHAALVEANDAVRRGRDDAVTDGPTLAAGIDEITIPLSRAGSFEAASAWIETFAAALEAAGVSGILAAQRPRRAYPDTCGVYVPTAILYLPGWFVHENTSSYGDLPLPGWEADPAVRERLVDWTVDWAANLVAGIEPTRPESAEVFTIINADSRPMTPQLAKVRLARRLTDSTLLWRPDPARAHEVNYDPRGRLMLQAFDHDRPWQYIIEDLRALLIERASEVEMALIRQCAHGVRRVQEAISKYEPRPPYIRTTGAYHTYMRHQDTSRIADAYGLQVLTDAHLTGAHDLSRWHVTDLGDGRHLVEHPDLAAWYAQPQPDPDVLAQAREDFGDMILSQR